MAANDSVVERQEVYEDLRNHGCCERCCLRYFGERNPESYRSVKAALVKIGLENEDFDSGPKQKILKCNPCVACLGLLQEEFFTDDCVRKIVADVLKASYDCDIFTCALSLPVSFQLRAHSLWLYLLGKFPLTFVSRGLPQEAHVISVKEAWKWTVAPVIAKAVNKELDSGIKSDFIVGVNMIYPDDEDECSCLLEMHADVFKIRKNQKRKYQGNLYTRKAVAMALQTTEAAHFKPYYPLPPPIPTAPVAFDNITCTHNSLFIAGRYNKFSRTLSQTPWVIDGERRMESSVQEIISERLEAASKAEKMKFSAAGREDVDVRTLGRGRPFVCELQNPHRVKFTAGQMQSMEADINNSSKEVAIRDLQIVQKDELMKLKAGEEKTVKRYMALCISCDSIEARSLEQLGNVKDITLSQKTPVRVLHRRPLVTRSKIVHSMRAWLLENPTKLCKKEDVTLFKLDIQAQAGTYIKEFVHGDFGRTQPSLGQLLGGVHVDILALDVQDIELDWPPVVRCAQ